MAAWKDPVDDFLSCGCVSGELSVVPRENCSVWYNAHTNTQDHTRSHKSTKDHTTHKQQETLRLRQREEMGDWWADISLMGLAVCRKSNNKICHVCCCYGEVVLATKKS